MTKQLKRPEVLSPAGTLEKLKVAVRYGADAVFIGGQAYGLRSRAGNFTFEPRSMLRPIWSCMKEMKLELVNGSVAYGILESQQSLFQTLP